MKILFTVPDKTLTYNCRACGSLCCSGKGFGLNSSRPQEQALLQKYPALQYFIKTAGSPHFTELDSFEGKCFFLTEEGQCRVQKEGGLEAKPFVCRLFPLNLFTLAQDLLIVDLHPMCPVEIAGQGELVDLAETTSELQSLDPELFKQFAIKEIQTAQEVTEVIFKEQSQARSAAEMLSDQYLKELTDFLDYPFPLTESAHLAKLFKVLNLSLRAKILLSRVKLIKAEEYHQIADRFMLALYLYAHILQGLDKRPLSIKTVLDLFNKKWTLFYFLAHLSGQPTFEIAGKFDEKNLPSSSEAAADKLFSTYVYQMTKGRFPSSSLRSLIEGKLPLPSLSDKLTFIQRLGNINKQLRFKRSA